MRNIAIRALLCAGLALPASLATAPPLHAQYSNTYNFLKGVRDGDFAAVQEALDQPGSTVINVRDRGSGEGALHIATRARDSQMLLYLLQSGANPNLRDRDGNAALHIAAQIGFNEAVRWLGMVNATVDATNNRGETPLILAVQQRHADTVNQLIENGADPDIPDSVVGMSARDYAERDTRGRRLLEILDRARPQTPNREQVGPTLD